jgi:hypothetical protein
MCCITLKPLIQWNSRELLTPELIARLMGVVVFERQRLSRFCHDIGMVDIKHEYQTSFGLYTQRTQLAEGRENLIWT